jgi:hypothetical protein
MPDVEVLYRGKGRNRVTELLDGRELPFWHEIAISRVPGESQTTAE